MLCRLKTSRRLKTLCGIGSDWNEFYEPMNNALSTTAPHAQGGFTEDAFEAFLKQRDEPSWLTDRRREAFARFQAFAWPSARDEEWRRTDIRAFKLDSFAPPGPEQPAAEARGALDRLWEGLSSHYATGIQHVNGAAVRHADPARLGGAVFLDLNAAVKDHPELVRRSLMTEAVTAADDIFAALHGAFWTGGTLLYVPRGLRSRRRCSAWRGWSTRVVSISAIRWSCSNRMPRQRSSGRRLPAGAARLPGSTSGPSRSCRGRAPGSGW